ncbi:MAG: hypothetical protein OEL91_05450 [Burkholderiaceae bacterium]|nr:hypothetical protein [Burkholderiaceae bacterium]
MARALQSRVQMAKRAHYLALGAVAQVLRDAIALAFVQAVDE